MTQFQLDFKRKTAQSNQGKVCRVTGTLKIWMSIWLFFLIELDEAKQRLLVLGNNNNTNHSRDARWETIQSRWEHNSWATDSTTPDGPIVWWWSWPLRVIVIVPMDLDHAHQVFIRLPACVRVVVVEQNLIMFHLLPEQQEQHSAWALPSRLNQIRFELVIFLSLVRTAFGIWNSILRNHPEECPLEMAFSTIYIRTPRNSKRTFGLNLFFYAFCLIVISREFQSTPVHQKGEEGCVHFRTILGACWFVTYWILDL